MMPLSWHRERIELVLGELRAAMAADGGGAELAMLSEGNVSIRLIGACRFCPSQVLTIEQTLRPRLSEALPEDWTLTFTA